MGATTPRARSGTSRARTDPTVARSTVASRVSSRASGGNPRRRVPRPCGRGETSSGVILLTLSRRPPREDGGTSKPRPLAGGCAIQLQHVSSGVWPYGKRASSGIAKVSTGAGSSLPVTRGPARSARRSSARPFPSIARGWGDAAAATPEVLLSDGTRRGRLGRVGARSGGLKESRRR